MDFDIAEDLRLLRQMVRRFVDNELIPLEGRSLDGAELKPEIERRMIQRCKNLWLSQIDVPEDYGGQGDMRERHLFPVTRGEKDSCFAQTEPDAGSDPGAMTTVAAADMRLQVHGGIGLTTSLPIELLWRDQRSHMLTEGTPEIMRRALARHVLQQFAN